MSVGTVAADAALLANSGNEAVESTYFEIGNSVPGEVLGIQAFVGTAWWIIGMFLYIKNVSADRLQLNDRTETFPILWWWEQIAGVPYVVDTTYKYVWISVSLLS